MNLFEAVKHRNIAHIKTWIADGKPVNDKDVDGNTPLHYATFADDFTVAELLVKAGADVNAQNIIQDSPFLYAGANGYTNLVKLYLDHGANFYVLNRYGGTALIPAAEKGHLETVKLLIEVPDFPINHVNRLGWTALMEAVLLSDGGPKQQEIIKLLLDAGADKNIPDLDGITALQHAKTRKFEAVTALLQ
ncbi:ankyrin repeat domain-containing protein [Vaginella massiliensis]|uniref:ankyrin repeat domain-containing protein n=1 Tax=Vaginella massiliensis TaxID=1816680 RepID=UPI000B9A51B4|nr:ankyrin repeat domain-containing protein [Vaginella massiliensis]